MPPKSKTRSLVYGYTGYQNTGDELLLHALLTGIDDAGLPLAISVMSRDPEVTRRVHGVDSPDHDAFGGGVKMSLLTRWRRCRAIMAANVMLVGPGGFLQDYDQRGSHNMFGMLRVVLLARLFGARVVGIGLGAGPLIRPWGRRFTRWLCNRCDLLAMRDQESIDLLASIGVDRSRMHLTGDLAFALPAISRMQSTPPTLGVSVFEFYGYIQGEEERSEPVRAAIAACLDEVAAQGIRIAFVSMQGTFGGHDELEAKAIAELMQHKGCVTIHPYQEDPRDTLAIIARFDWMLGMRLHSLIMALLASVPFAAISYHPKVNSLMASLGMSQCQIGLDTLTQETLAPLIDALLGKKELETETISVSNTLRAEAEKNFELLGQFLLGDDAPQI